MENAWNEYTRLESDVDWLRSALQAHMNRVDLTQVGVTATRTEERTKCKDLNWRLGERLLVSLCFSKRKPRSGKSCGGSRMSWQASAQAKPTTKSQSPPSSTQVGLSNWLQTLHAVRQANQLVKLALRLPVVRRRHRVLNHIVCVQPYSPREEICAFSVGIISAFSV